MAATTEAAVNQKRYPDDEFARRGPEIFQRVVAPRLTAADDGKYVVLDIETEEYEIDADKLAAALRLHARVPGMQGWLVQVGRPTPTRMQPPPAEMITGSVSADRDAVIPLRVFGPDGETDTVEAVVDTGFTGHLALPPGVVAFLGLPWVMDDELVLADGSAVFLPVHLGRVQWHGAVRDVLVFAVDSDPLVGMELLGDSELWMDCRPGGAVEITQTAPPPAPAP